MAFNLASLFRDEDRGIISVEEDTDVDYLDKIPKDAFGESEDSGGNRETVIIKASPVETVNSTIEEKIKSIELVSKLSREKIDKFYNKMKDTPDVAKRMIESILEIMTEEEKERKDIESLVEVLGSKLSPDNLAKIVSAFIILVENNLIDEVL